MSGVKANGTKPDGFDPSCSLQGNSGAPLRTAPKGVTLEYGIPVEVRVEAEIRPGRRMRRTAPSSLRVTVNYHLSALVDEGSGNCLFGEFRDEEQMSAFFHSGITQAVKASRRALKKAIQAPARISTAQVHCPKAPLEPRQDEVAVPRDLMIPVDMEVTAVDLEQDWLNEQPEPSVTPSIPKGVSSAQRRTLKIMQDQLHLSEKEFQDILEMHCNRPRLDALNYNEAAGLITRLSRQVRQKLELERRNV